MCGGPASPDTFSAPEMMSGSREAFAYRQCGDCASLWAQEPPSDLARFYAADYYAHGTPQRFAPSPLRTAVGEVVRRLPRSVQVAAARHTPIPPFFSWLSGTRTTRSSAIADVGSGEGVLLHVMARYGFADLTGFDPFLAAESSHGAVRLRREGLADAGQTFDLVMFHHSLEHVAEPLAALVGARDRLRDGGHLLVRLPVVNRAWALYGVDWVGLDPPRHLAIPTVCGFRALADRAGLRIVRTFFDSYALQFWGSENYRAGVPLKDGPVGVAPSTMAAWERESRRLNDAGLGDAAGFVLRRR